MCGWKKGPLSDVLMALRGLGAARGCKPGLGDNSVARAGLD